eukprot:m.221228 g.221228  ORF g.221228 m.221228 type:complete len:323 (-) comp19183_c0_seq2:417-1385(-)
MGHDFRSVAAAIILTEISLRAMAVDSSKDMSDPIDVITSVGNTLLSNDHTFINWEGGFTYGAAVVVDGLYESMQLVKDTVQKRWRATLTKNLEAYTEKSHDEIVPCTKSFAYGPAGKYRNCAHVLSNGPRLSWNASCLGTIGDRFGMFPIAYLQRYLMEGRSMDITIASAAVVDYVMPYPNTLPDGTFSRLSGCCDADRSAHGVQPPSRAVYLWADDQYMGLALLARLAACERCNATRGIRLQWAKRAAAMQVAFAEYLHDPTDMLRFHGAKWINASFTAHSCCKWGRANGWGLLSTVEVLLAMEKFPELATLRVSIILHAT